MKKQMTYMAVAAVLLLTGSFVAACDVGGVGGGQGVSEVIERLGSISDECDGPVNGYGAIDVSVSGQGDDLIASRTEMMRDLADRVAACTGYLKLVAFSGSAAGTAVLAEHEYESNSGTENARLIAADKETETVIGEAEDELSGAIRDASTESTDVIGQLYLASEFQRQRSGVGQLVAAIATDGVNTAPPYRMDPRRFDLDRAARLAGMVVPPDLTEARVLLAGIGKVAGDGNVQLPTPNTIAISRFYELLGERSGAEITATTDYTEGN